MLNIFVTLGSESGVWYFSTRPDKINCYDNFFFLTVFSPCQFSGLWLYVWSISGVCICTLQACPLTSGSWCSVHNGPGHVRGEKVKPMSCDTTCWQTARCCPYPTSTLKSKTWHQVLFHLCLFILCNLFLKLSKNQTP